MWLNTNTNNIYNYIHEIRQAFPDISLPENPTDSDFERIAVYPVSQTPIPIYDLITQGCKELAPQQDASGNWARVYEVFYLPQEQVTANELAKRERILNDVVIQTQRRLDDFAKTRNYDGILSLCTYATSSVPKFQGEGQYGVQARDATWAKLYEIMAEVEAGIRPMPESFSDVEPELPVLEWPAA